MRIRDWGLGTGDWDWGKGRQGRQGRIYFSTQYRLNAVPRLTALITQHSLLSTQHSLLITHYSADEN
ncbi:hypothetical protein [Nostoc sp. CMAA1605]|uniref:hypothetical protein n=1 Tax=Nostoc sp. CMAA1605 TaxID=2055159 RepID=UPI001F41BBD2|nr:hypothetical protein [Nostoc sp. CMAA1605]